MRAHFSLGRTPSGPSSRPCFCAVFFFYGLDTSLSVSHSMESTSQLLGRLDGLASHSGGGVGCINAPSRFMQRRKGPLIHEMAQTLTWSPVSSVHAWRVSFCNRLFVILSRLHSSTSGFVTASHAFSISSAAWITIVMVN